MNKKTLDLLEKIQNKLNEEQNVIGGREAKRQGVNLVDLDPESAREIAEMLADKLGVQLGKEIGRGTIGQRGQPSPGSGIVYEIRTEEGKGRDMVLKITQFPHEKRGYTLARWKKRQLEYKKPELASILPEIGQIVDIIYDIKSGWLSGNSIKVYGIPVERLVPLPNRVKEQLFGHAGTFKSEEAEKEWLFDISDPKMLIPALRDNFGEKLYRERDGDRWYTYFAEIPPNEAENRLGRTKMQAGQEFERLVLDLESPKSFNDYRGRWIRQIRKLAMRFADNTPTSSSIYTSPKKKLEMQANRLVKRLEDAIKIPREPPAAGSSSIEDASLKRPEDGNLVDQFYNKLMALSSEGVVFWDTHRGNVMMRPSTNEIVISDVGWFTYAEKLAS